jgi:hypothetical protein
MDFKKATDELFVSVTAENLANEAGVARQSILQARMDESARGRRAPPADWQKAVLKLAEKQAAHFARLAAKLRAI